MKVLSIKAYHSIPHLPKSRMGRAEKVVDYNKVRMLTQECLHDGDRVIVQEKLDGSCVCAYRKGDRILALGRESDLASESPNEGRQLWSIWWLERGDRSLFMAKYVQPEKIDGCYLAENTHNSTLWNWHPHLKLWHEYA